MPIEMRVLLYNDQEVVAALASFYRKSGRPLAVGQIARYVVHEEGGVRVSLAIETVDGEVVKHEVTESDLAAALVMQAIGMLGPLPPEAEKRISVIEGEVTLVIHRRRSRSDDPGRVPGPRVPSARVRF